MRRRLFAAVSAVVVVLTVIGSKPAAAQDIYCLARLGLAEPLPVLELPTMHGNRIRYPQLL